MSLSPFLKLAAIGVAILAVPVALRELILLVAPPRPAA